MLVHRRQLAANDQLAKKEADYSIRASEQLALAENEGEIFIFRSQDERSGAGVGEATPVNVYLNGEYLASLLPGHYAKSRACVGWSRLNAALRDASNAYQAKHAAGLSVEVVRQQTQYFRVELQNEAVLQPVSSTTAEKAISGLSLQKHTLSRVDKRNCAATAAPVVASTPSPYREYTLSADPLFKFDKSDRTSILRGGQAEITAVARDILKNLPSVSRVDVVGHTDSDRVEVIQRTPFAGGEHKPWREALVDAGVPRSLIRPYGRGASEPVITSCKQRDRNERNDCNEPNRRVQIRAIGKNK